ncbi:pyridoxal-phosphate dependent enzyme [Streptomyces sp.]|uniref:pyridoxal-phosphate dependent enzyme n=1 Tax=Streptomyces sp. TaxID=1931 RepID=UPI0025CE9A47|nr:pyridoxal-phosphate dependent enzyme [Streptomyces sp.]
MQTALMGRLLIPGERPGDRRQPVPPADRPRCRGGDLPRAGRGRRLPGGLAAPAGGAPVRLPDSFCPEQYSNPDNPASYRVIAELLADQLGTVDCLVGPVGSGGSMCGNTRALREHTPQTRAIGVDSHRSLLLGQPDGPRQLRGIGNSL